MTAKVRRLPLPQANRDEEAKISLPLTVRNKLSDGYAVAARENIKRLSKFVISMNLTMLNIYELSEEITTAYSQQEDKSSKLESLNFATINFNNGLDILKDLIFFQNLKQLYIWYNEKDWDNDIVKSFNEEVLSDIILQVWVNLQSLAIGGLVNNDGAKIIAECLEKYK